MSLVLSQKTATVGVQERVGSSDFCKLVLQLCGPGDGAFYKSGWRATYGHSQRRGEFAGSGGQSKLGHRWIW